MDRVPVSRLAGFYFAYYAALGAYTPYFSVYLHARGLDAVAISTVMSLWYATRVLAPTTWSWAAGRSPRPVRWLRGGASLMLAGFVPFLWPLPYAGLALAMLVYAFFANAIMPQFEALTLSHLPGRSERYGSIRVWGSIGFIAVVLLYGQLFDHLEVRWLPALMLPWLVLVLALRLGNEYGPGHHDAPAAAEGIGAIVRRREVIAFFVITLLMQMGFGPYHTLFSLYLRHHGYSPGAIGALWAVGVGIEIVVFFLAARFLLRFAPRTVMLAGLLSAAARWTATALLPQHAWVMVLAQLVHALNFAAFYAAAMRLLTRYFPGRLLGHGQGLYYGFSSGVGGVLGALLTGRLWALDDGRSAFLMAAALCLLGAWVALRGLPAGS